MRADATVTKPTRGRRIPLASRGRSVLLRCPENASLLHEDRGHRSFSGRVRASPFRGGGGRERASCSLDSCSKLCRTQQQLAGSSSVGKRFRRYKTERRKQDRCRRNASGSPEIPSAPDHICRSECLSIRSNRECPRTGRGRKERRSLRNPKAVDCLRSAWEFQHRWLVRRRKKFWRRGPARRFEDQRAAG